MLSFVIINMLACLITNIPEVIIGNILFREIKILDTRHQKKYMCSASEQNYDLKDI